MRVIEPLDHYQDRVQCTTTQVRTKPRAVGAHQLLYRPAVDYRLGASPHGVDELVV